MEKKIIIIKLLIAIAVSAVAIIFIGGFFCDDITIRIDTPEEVAMLSVDGIDYLRAQAPQPFGSGLCTLQS